MTVTTTQTSAHSHTDRSVSSVASPTLGKRTAVLAYGLLSYGVGVASLLTLILVLLGVVHFGGGPLQVASPWVAAAIDLGLLAAFAIQHVIMARLGFKARLARVIPAAAERSTFVLATGLTLLPLLVLWQPLPGTVFALEAPLARGAVSTVAVLGWAYLFVASFAIDHFELFGVKQVVAYFRGKTLQSVPFRERWMYRFDRHPIMTGMLIGLWVTPTLTAGHLFMAVGFTAYLVLGVHLEEGNLITLWGDGYREYRRRVGSLVPTFRRTS